VLAWNAWASLVKDLNGFEDRLFFVRRIATCSDLHIDISLRQSRASGAQSLVIGKPVLCDLSCSFDVAAIYNMANGVQSIRAACFV
jgi:hypothetical protein